ncbi:hypothetical protein [Streptomyces cucumeris]|uniref:hypothetical protein n=1 Tax=Streptomyces cucumeris TaxID=2962890 RepID=UPI003D74E05D
MAHPGRQACLQLSSETTPWCQTLAGGKSGANLAGLDSNDHRAWPSGGYVSNGVPGRAQIHTLGGTTNTPPAADGTQGRISPVGTGESASPDP